MCTKITSLQLVCRETAESACGGGEGEELKEGVTHRVGAGVSLFLRHGVQQHHGGDGVQHEGEEQVLVERDPLAAQTPEGRGTEAPLQSGTGQRTL